MYGGKHSLQTSHKHVSVYPLPLWMVSMLLIVVMSHGYVEVFVLQEIDHFTAPV